MPFALPKNFEKMKCDWKREILKLFNQIQLMKQNTFISQIKEKLGGWKRILLSWNCE